MRVLLPILLLACAESEPPTSQRTELTTGGITSPPATNPPGYVPPRLEVALCAATTAGSLADFPVEGTVVAVGQVAADGSPLAGGVPLTAEGVACNADGHRTVSVEDADGEVWSVAWQVLDAAGNEQAEAVALSPGEHVVVDYADEQGWTAPGVKHLEIVRDGRSVVHVVEVGQTPVTTVAGLAVGRGPEVGDEYHGCGVSRWFALDVDGVVVEPGQWALLPGDGELVRVWHGRDADEVSTDCWDTWEYAAWAAWERAPGG